MKFYKLTFEDFKRVFSFATSYYLEPSKNTTGRTSSEPRGLGAIIDSFTLGKLTEIGVEKILNNHNPSKQYLLDFEIKKNNIVQNEPDIVNIIENNTSRKPNLFIEIKNTSDKDRWIGLTEEQLNTIKRSAKGKGIYLIYANIKSNFTNNNPKTADLSGMFLKEIEDLNKSKLFQNFSQLNAECKIEFILSLNELEKFGYAFEKGMNMYESDLFLLKKNKSIYSGKGLRKDIKRNECYQNFNDKIEIELSNSKKTENKDIGYFDIEGSFNLFYKKNSTLIECITDVKLTNNIFGFFKLEKNKIYDFNHKTMGRDPKLKRNNIFISKKKIYQLIESQQIKNPDEIIKNIAKEI